ncbi:hypothetical protein Nepgr_022797 [Nepenthes gracilis]|uniref:Uncharacterized protein n=1 Tax=Nepenthes gracilis TaxID=150966 RepID=A0AAD3XYH6_NEPGR|nr:hypothetical protein Nepgr_022797 [Nepenthes gracilis]
MPPKSKSTRRQIPLAPVGSVRVGKGPWRVKSKPIPAVESARPVLESNSFAALQCPEVDTSLDPSDGVMKKDALGFSEPDLSSTLIGKEADFRILTPSELEWENRGKPPLEIEGLVQDCFFEDEFRNQHEHKGAPYHQFVAKSKQHIHRLNVFNARKSQQYPPSMELPAKEQLHSPFQQDAFSLQDPPSSKHRKQPDSESKTCHTTPSQRSASVTLF